MLCLGNADAEGEATAAHAAGLPTELNIIDHVALSGSYLPTWGQLFSRHV